MNDYFYIFFIFSVLIFFITILIISNDKLSYSLNFLRIIKVISMVSPTIMSGIIVLFLFSNINSKIDNFSSTGAESIIVSSGLSIFGILASVWIGLNIYNTIEKKELNNVIEYSKNEIKIATKKLEDITKIQVESNLADSQENINEKSMHYNSIINKYNSYDLPYILRANFMFKNSRYQEAISDYSIALLKNNENEFLYYDRGKCYFEIEKYNDAINDFTKSINSNQYSSSAIKNRAEAYRKIKSFNKAIKDYTEIIDSMDPDYDIYNNRGLCYFELEEHDKAIHDYNKAIKLSDGKEKIHYINRIFANMGMSDNLGIIRDIDIIISKFGDNSEGLYLLRHNANLALGHTKDAEFDLSRYKKLKKLKSKNSEEAAVS